RSRSARGAVRRAAAPLLDHAGIPTARRSGLRARPRPGARLGRIPRDRQRRCPPLPPPLLVERRREAARPLSDRRPLGRDRGAHRRSAGAVRPRAVAAAGLVPDSAVGVVAKSDLAQELTRLESELKQLEAEYNMYFSGRLPKPPWETRARVAAL